MCSGSSILYITERKNNNVADTLCLSGWFLLTFSFYQIKVTLKLNLKISIFLNVHQMFEETTIMHKIFSKFIRECVGYLSVWCSYLKHKCGIGRNLWGAARWTVCIFRLTEHQAHLSFLHGTHNNVPCLDDLTCGNQPDSTSWIQYSCHSKKKSYK